MKRKLKGHTPRHLCRSVKHDRVQIAEKNARNPLHQVRFINPRSKRFAVEIALKSKLKSEVIPQAV